MPIRILDLTPHDMAKLMNKLAVNFGGKKDLEAKADLWYEKLQRYPLAIVERVVDRLLGPGEGKYFPQVGRALEIAREICPDAEGERESPRAQMRTWEQDPWASVQSLDLGSNCASAPCPVCESVIQFTPRGALIVHDAQRHLEANVPSYSNIGRPEWREMGPPVFPEPKKILQSRTPNPYPKPAPATPLAEVLPEVATP